MAPSPSSRRKPTRTLYTWLLDGGRAGQQLRVALRTRDRRPLRSQRVACLARLPAGGRSGGGERLRPLAPTSEQGRRRESGSGHAESHYRGPPTRPARPVPSGLYAHRLAAGARETVERVAADPGLGGGTRGHELRPVLLAS